MDFTNLLKEIENSANAEHAVKMSAYMRDQFTFLGIPTPLRKVLHKEHFQLAKKEKQIDWNFINDCWDRAFREYQYIALDYLMLMKKHLTVSDIPHLKRLAITKSWWDTVDGIDGLVGTIVLNNPEVEQLMITWSTDDNIWLRRIAIDHQLSRKEKTNINLLEKIITNNLGQTEFFINKAIGWSLRDYSKTNPQWVREFIEKYRERLAPLSIREASKYL